MTAVSEIDRARSALFACDPSVGRTDWCRIGMAAKAAGLDLQDFTEWSRCAANFKDDRDCADAWRSFKPDGGVTAATLFALARQGGWSEERAPAAPPRRDRWNSPARLWADGVPAAPDHPYIRRKWGLPDGLRMIRGPLEGWGPFKGRDLAGWLAVPAYDPRGALQSVQLIGPAKGEKLNAPGASLTGATFTLGQMTPGGVAYIVEGLAHAWTCHHLTGAPAVVTFGKAGLSRAAEAARAAGARPVVIADRGAEAEAEAAARASGGGWVALPDDLINGADINDLYQMRGDRAALGALQAVEWFQREAEPASTQDDAAPIRATPFAWRDPKTIPPRPWLYGRHLLRGQVSVTVAPGGIGKSSLTIVEALAMTSARQLLDEWTHPQPLRVWIFNLEDPRDELERRVVAAMMHHGVGADMIADRLFLDSGRERGLCTAIEVRGDVTIVKPEIDALAAQITAHAIDVLVVDPFVSSHRVSENASGAIDLVAKEWASLAHRCGCAIELVHHTRKTNGATATSEDGRGSSALLAAARSGRVLNRMTAEDRERAGLRDDPATVFAIDRDKHNLAPAGKRAWVRMASVELGQGDQVGVAEIWHWPDAFDGVSIRDVARVQAAIAALPEPPRESVQAKAWAGHVVAEVLGIDLSDPAGKARVKALIKGWTATGVLRVVAVFSKRDGRELPCIVVGEPITDTE